MQFSVICTRSDIHECKTSVYLSLKRIVVIIERVLSTIIISNANLYEKYTKYRYYYIFITYFVVL